ncbi:MAG: peptidyl-prolyl cis-trans isomerase [Verrucomicrobiota bacterium]
MRRLILSVAACLLLAASAQAAVINGVVVIVNDAVITFKEMLDQTALAEEQLVRLYGNQPNVLEQKIAEVRENAIRLLVERQLILHDFKASGYTIPDSVIEDHIQDRIRRQFGDRLTLMRTLREEGTTYERFRQEVREQFIVEALRAKNVSGEIVISPYKIETYYQQHKDEFKTDDQVKLRMIVINQLAGNPPGTAKKLCEEILAKLKEGASFAEMATIYSEGSQRRQGGDWGWVDKSVLRKELADAAFKLEPGQFSGVIETPESCYVMQVEEKRTAGVKPLADVRDEIEKTLDAQERARRQGNYIKRLEKKSLIRRF